VTATSAESAVAPASAATESARSSLAVEDGAALACSIGTPTVICGSIGVFSAGSSTGNATIGRGIGGDAGGTATRVGGGARFSGGESGAKTIAGAAVPSPRTACTIAGVDCTIVADGVTGAADRPDAVAEGTSRYSSASMSGRHGAGRGRAQRLLTASRQRNMGNSSASMPTRQVGGPRIPAYRRHPTENLSKRGRLRRRRVAHSLTGVNGSPSRGACRRTRGSGIVEHRDVK
jgi:hypothetical protein